MAHFICRNCGDVLISKVVGVSSDRKDDYYCYGCERIRIMFKFMRFTDDEWQNLVQWLKQLARQDRLTDG